MKFSSALLAGSLLFAVGCASSAAVDPSDSGPNGPDASTEPDALTGDGFGTECERNSDCARVPTGPYDLGTLDHVTTDFARGFCAVQHPTHVPIGDDAARGRFDDAFGDWDVFEDGEDDDLRMDHATVICDLYWPAAG